jgi:hypothetical protein
MLALSRSDICGLYTGAAFTSAHTCRNIYFLAYLDLPFAD